MVLKVKIPPPDVILKLKTGVLFLNSTIIRNMRKPVILLLFCVSFVQAQVVKPDSTSKWHKKLALGLNFNQASFSTNWKAGSVNFVGMNSLFNYEADYKGDSVVSWDNQIDLEYGFVNNQGQGYRKSIDKIYLDTKYGRQISAKWNAFTSLTFASQFAKGYQYDDEDHTKALVSDFFAPAYITSAWGAEYQPTDYFNLRISPFAPRITIVSDPERFVTADRPEPFGVKPPDQLREEWLGFQVQAEFNKDIATNVNLQWRYVLFGDYQTLEAKKIDHRLDLMLTGHISKFLTAGFGTIILYDYDQDSKVQLSQVFNVGFAYSFQNFANPAQ